MKLGGDRDIFACPVRQVMRGGVEDAAAATRGADEMPESAGIAIEKRVAKPAIPNGLAVVQGCEVASVGGHGEVEPFVGISAPNIRNDVRLTVRSDLDAALIALAEVGEEAVGLHPVNLPRRSRRRGCRVGCMATLPFPTGTFFQGWLAASYSERQIRDEFGFMAEAGIRDVIVQTTLDEFGDHPLGPRWTPTEMLALYPSRLSGARYRGATDDTVRTILESAAHWGMRVFFGLNLYHAAWFYDDINRLFVNDAAWVRAEAERGNAVAEELYARYRSQFPETFYGWYWAWEVDNSSTLNRSGARDSIAAMLRTNVDRLREIDPAMPVMVSCFYNDELGSPDEYATFWSSVLSQVPRFGDGDLFAPQDGVGADHVSIRRLGEWFGAFQSFTAMRPGLSLWANCETFQQGTGGLVSAPWWRIVEQFEGVAPLVEGIVTFAYPHFQSPQVVDRTLHDAWVAYRRQFPIGFTTSP